MIKVCTPLETPLTWREFLYNSVVLKWETDSLNCRKGDFNKQTLQEQLRLEIQSKKKLEDMDSAELEFAKRANEFLVLYREGAGWRPVFKKLRDMAAHGDYSIERNGWIKIRHRYKGRDRKEHTRVFGTLRFKTLKALVSFIDQSTP